MLATPCPTLSKLDGLVQVTVVPSRVVVIVGGNCATSPVPRPDELMAIRRMLRLPVTEPIMHCRSSAELPLGRVNASSLMVPVFVYQ